MIFAKSLWLLPAGLVVVGSSLVWADGPTAAGTPGDKKILAGPKPADAGGQTLAERKPGAPGERGARLARLREVLKDLNLSDDQMAKIKAIFQEEKAQFQQWESAHKDELTALREERKAAIQARDKAKVQEIDGKLMEILATAPKIEDFLAKIKAVLTDEQKAQLEEKLKEIREKGPATRPAAKLGDKRGN
jgi:Spy/CpxP family protein refolding chaperone